MTVENTNKYNVGEKLYYLSGCGFASMIVESVNSYVEKGVCIYYYKGKDINGNFISRYERDVHILKSEILSKLLVNANGRLMDAKEECELIEMALSKALKEESEK